jgi:hypothetical protein
MIILENKTSEFLARRCATLKPETPPPIITTVFL